MNRPAGAWILGPLAALILPTLCPMIGAAPAPPVEYVYVPDTSRCLELYRGGYMLLGKVDSTGKFEVERKYPLGSFVSPMPLTRIVNTAGKACKAYEFRSGKLILGTLTANGDFVPETDPKIIRFEDYKYRWEGIQIWNLPGYFMRKDKLEERRAWLAEHLPGNPQYAGEKARLDAAAGNKK